jgi:hypothetical protein
MKSKLLIVSALALVSTLGPQFSTVLAQGTAFTYQGRLNDGGSPAQGVYDLQFAIYDALSGGAQVGISLTNAATPLANGLFTVTLDFGGSVFTGNARWLEIGVRTNSGGAFTTLAPRQALTPTPYAVFTANAFAAATANVASFAYGAPASGLTGTLGIGQLPGAVITNNATSVTLAGTFTGNGAGLTNIPFSALPAVPLTNNQSGVTLKGLTTVSNLSVTATNFVNYLVVSNSPAFNGSAITNLNASQLAAGTVPLGLLPGAVLTNNQSGVTLKGLTTVSNLSVTATNFVNYLVVTNAPALNGSAITNLNASQLTGGTVPLALLPGAVVTNNASGVNLTGSFSGNGAGVSNVNLMTINDQGAISWATNWGTFLLTSSPGVGSGPYGVTAADVNGDGKLDLISVNNFANTLSVLTNDGSGGFVLASSPAVGNSPYSVVAADVNGDGKVDLISVNNAVSTLSVLTNNGSGGFVLASSPAAGANPQWVTAADVNGDGKADLITANFGASTLSVLTNNGSGGFVLASSPAVGTTPNFVTAADVSGDGKVDLITANFGANTLSVLTNNGSGGFVLAANLGVGSGPAAVAAADVNGDGKLDLISVNANANSISVLTNNGSGGFSLAGTVAVGSVPESLTVADVNRDGKLDLISANYTGNTLSVLTNNGSGGFSLAGTVAVGSNPRCVTAADVNGDGSVDLISANSANNALSVLFNTSSYSAMFQGAVSGDGSSLHNLDASQLAAGLVPLARLPGGVVTNNETGVTLAGTFTGSGAGLSNVNADLLDGQQGAWYQSATNLTGTLADARLSTNVALLNALQTFTGSNRFAGIVTATNTANTFIGAFTGNGGGLTNLNASQFTSGTLPLAQLPAVAVTNNATGVTLTGAFSGGGGGLTNLNAVNLTGTIADARLSANVALLNANQSFAGTNLFSQPVGIGSANPGQLLQVGDAGTPGSQGMIRFGSRSPTNIAYRTWDVGVPQTGGDTTGIGYSFVINDTLLGTDPEFLIRWGTGRVGIGRTNPATALDVNGTVTATGFAGNGASLTSLPGTLVWQIVTNLTVAAQPDAGYLAAGATQVSLTLPASPTVGDVIRVSGAGAGGWKIAQNASQSVFVGTTATLSPGVTWIARESSRSWVSVASSADGNKLVAAVNSGQIYTSTDSGVTWTARDSSRGWQSVASSADGSRLVAVNDASGAGGMIYTSTDSGVTWTARGISTKWSSVASSADGSKLIAVVNPGQIYTSTDSGTNWIARESSRSWRNAASSSDGSKLAAVAYGGQIYTSTNSGTNWTARESGRNWMSVASSADGSKLVAGAGVGQIYTSSDSGVTWTARADVGNWWSVASSADGSKLAAANSIYQIYTSTDSGVTWTARGSSANWYSVASSADGSKLVGVVSYGQIYTSAPASVLPSSTTTVGTGGYLTGGQLTALELQYIGSGQFMPLSYVGTIFAY